MKTTITSLILFALSAFAASCTDRPLVDATGTWRTDLTWLTGSCMFELPPVAGIVVTKVGNLYRIDESTPGVAVSGMVTCTTSQCLLSFTEAGPGPSGSTVSISANLAVDDSDAVSGSGSVRYQLADGTACYELFSATGVKI